MKQLLTGSEYPDAVVRRSSAHDPRIVTQPFEEPRYLQKRPDLTNARGNLPR